MQINKIVYNNTVYYNGKYKYNPTITGLNLILEEIITADSTTKYLEVIPFYINEHLDKQIEFEEYIFYIECRDWFDEKQQDIHIKECINAENRPLTFVDSNLGAILYPLCKHDDTDSYKMAIMNYKEGLKEIFPHMMETAKLEMELKEEDLPFGYFCFEINSE